MKAWNKGHGAHGAGRTRNASGYIMVLCPGHPGGTRGGYIYEHRLKMERKLGRRLRRNEVVHHKNGVKSDNRLSNLQLVTPSGHQKHHSRMSGGIRFKTIKMRAKILVLFSRGWLINRICRAVKLSEPTVRKVVIKEGLKIPNPTRTMRHVDKYWRKRGIFRKYK